MTWVTGATCSWSLVLFLLWKRQQVLCNCFLVRVQISLLAPVVLLRLMVVELVAWIRWVEEEV